MIYTYDFQINDAIVASIELTEPVSHLTVGGIVTLDLGGEIFPPPVERNLRLVVDRIDSDIAVRDRVNTRMLTTVHCKRASP
ncbi:hypothetical protein [Synechococcus phage Yong-M2-251]|nr:hypothetical protein [Synechococcus phage Yong-M2-251]